MRAILASLFVCLLVAKGLALAVSPMLATSPSHRVSIDADALCLAAGDHRTPADERNDASHCCIRCIAQARAADARTSPPADEAHEAPRAGAPGSRPADHAVSFDDTNFFRTSFNRDSRK
jgi:hypothetical protein